MKTIEEYHISKLFDENSNKIHHIIKNNAGEIIYKMSYKITRNLDRPLSPVDYLEEALDGKQIQVIPQYNRELQNLVFELHLLNVCKSDNDKKKSFFIYKLKACIKALFPMLT